MATLIIGVCMIRDTGGAAPVPRHPMSRHFDNELCHLKAQLLFMAAAVESQLQDVVEALTTRHQELAYQVMTNDHLVDQFDVEIDETCLALLALYKPTAGDLRFITTTMKISGELERMSDLAVNIAERVVELNAEPQLKPYIDITAMAKRSTGMVQDALEAFVNRDAALARRVCRCDQYMDDLTEQLFRELMSFMLEDPKTISRATRLTFIGKYYERIADHATNVAELVVYMVEGKIVRHLSSEYQSDQEFE